MSFQLRNMKVTNTTNSGKEVQFNEDKKEKEA